MFNFSFCFKQTGDFTNNEGTTFIRQKNKLVKIMNFTLKKVGIVDTEEERKNVYRLQSKDVITGEIKER